MNREKSCGCIIIKDNKVLLIKSNASGVWGFPKGHVEGNENEQETALREVKEETNLDVEICSSKRYTQKYIVCKNTEKEVVYFIAKLIGGEEKPQVEEIEQLKWMNYEEAVKTITFKNTREILKRMWKEKNANKI
jgi:tRNA nucleotidyltransferase (CCA-adding enzyme)